MLYSIIPPVLVVLSLIGIILFLVKKAPRVSEIKDGIISDVKNNQISEETIISPLGKSDEAQEEKGKRLKQGILLTMEKMTLRMKLVFLKLENLFTGLGDSIRERRKSSAVHKEPIVLENKDEESDIIQEKDRDLLKKENEKDMDIPAITVQGITSSSFSKGKDLVPEKVAEKKDLFEKIMIERIAANPKDIEAYEKLGEHYMDVENWDHAKECFKQVIKLSPGNKNIKAKMRKLERMFSKNNPV